jgi:serine/threonine protein kinase/tetratricopeptide (TPR) repeat protein
MEPKQVVSHYEILEAIGRGGMGEVFKARDLQLERVVAIKFLPHSIEASETQRQRFVQEAKTASSLDHPNICTIHEIGSAPDGHLFIAMAYYDGETLKQKIDRGQLELVESVDIAMQVARGLAKAHAKGIIHRDIKPANLIITSDGIVKILDFGLAKLGGGSTLTRPGIILGTFAYMSPEQIEGEADQRTDLWSLGVVLYEMLTGRRPFEADTENTAIYQILHQQPRKLATFRPAVPAALEHIIARALEKDRTRRYPSAEGLLEDLRLALPRSSQDLVATDEVYYATRMAARVPSIVVLPFANLGHQPDAEYFSDGLAEELIYALCQVEGLRVVSRVSAFEFKGKSQKLTQIARELNVTSVLNGSVRRAGDRLRINVELTNAADGFSLWSERFDREMKDVFAIQDEIASSVVRILKLKLADQETAPFTPRYIGHPEAYNLYLKGRYYYNKNTVEGFQKAGECFEKAIAVDASCAPAYSGLADFHMALGIWSVVEPKEAWPKTRECAMKAMQLDGRLPEPHVTIAKIYQFGDWNRQAAEAAFRRAIQLSPGHSDAHFAYSVFLLQMGLLGQALDEIKRAHDLDPLNLRVATGVAWLYYYLADYQRALDECQLVLDLSPDYPEAQCCIALCSEKMGRPADHVAWFERAAAGSARMPMVLGLLGRAYALNGQTDKARALQTELQAIAERRYTSQVAHALVAMGLGELDSAMQWLQEAFQAHDAFLCYAKVFPPYDALREQPRFQEMLRQMGVADPSTSATVAM